MTQLPSLLINSVFRGSCGVWETMRSDVWGTISVVEYFSGPWTKTKHKVKFRENVIRVCYDIVSSWEEENWDRKKRNKKRNWNLLQLSGSVTDEKLHAIFTTSFKSNAVLEIDTWSDVISNVTPSGFLSLQTLIVRVQ